MLKGTLGKAEIGKAESRNGTTGRRTAIGALVVWKAPEGPFQSSHWQSCPDGVSYRLGVGFALEARTKPPQSLGAAVSCLPVVMPVYNDATTVNDGVVVSRFPDRRGVQWVRVQSNGSSGGRGDEHEIREIGPEVASVGGGQSVGLQGGVGGNQEIGDEMLAWPAFAPMHDGATMSGLSTSARIAGSGQSRSSPLIRLSSGCGIVVGIAGRCCPSWWSTPRYTATCPA